MTVDWNEVVGRVQEACKDLGLTYLGCVSIPVRYRDNWMDLVEFDEREFEANPGKTAEVVAAKMQIVEYLLKRKDDNYDTD